MRIPPKNLSVEATPWANWAEQSITQLQQDAERRAQGETNMNKGQTGALATLANNIVNLAQRVTDAFAALTVTAAQVTSGVLADARIPTLDQSKITGTWDKAVSTAGAVAGGTGTFNSGLASTDVYSHLVTYGSYHATWTNVDGTIGYAPSSQRFKQDIKSASLEIRELIDRVRVVTFRYTAAVEAVGDDAAVEWGVIAEEIDALGLPWLVDYDEHGLPFGVKAERLALLLILDAQEKQHQLDTLSNRIEDLELAA